MVIIPSKDKKRCGRTHWRAGLGCVWSRMVDERCYINGKSQRTPECYEKRQRTWIVMRSREPDVCILVYNLSFTGFIVSLQHVLPLTLSGHIPLFIQSICLSAYLCYPHICTTFVYCSLYICDSVNRSFSDCISQSPHFYSFFFLSISITVWERDRDIAFVRMCVFQPHFPGRLCTWWRSLRCAILPSLSCS